MPRKVSSKGMTKYPSGPINQHKALATGASLPKCDTSNRETVPNPWGGQKGVPGKVRKSGTSTGNMSHHGTVSHKVTPP
jgi:hypothetical protein